MRSSRGSGAPDVWWFRPDGRRMNQADWTRGDAFALGAFLNGAEIPTLTAEGEPIADDSFIVLFNAWREPVTFVLPPTRFGRRWAHELCTAEPDLPPNGDDAPGAGRGAGPRACAQGAAARRLAAAQSAAGGGCFSTCRQTSTTTRVELRAGGAREAPERLFDGSASR